MGVRSLDGVVNGRGKELVCAIALGVFQLAESLVFLGCQCPLVCQLTHRASRRGSDAVGARRRR